MNSRTRMLARLVAVAVVAVLAVGGGLYLTRSTEPAVGGPVPTPGLSGSPSQAAGQSETAAPSTAPSSVGLLPRAAGWSDTGSMVTPRFGHTSVVLRDGKVLVFNGIGSRGGCCLASAELYDPASGTWAPTGSMAVRRETYTTTLLLDGRVLVAGGAPDTVVGSHVVGDASAELYDPSTRTWSATGNMTTPRSYHSATLLPDGRVLVAGGQLTAKDLTLSSAELYDPSRGTWTTTRRMVVPGGGPATLLANGKVLVAGGYDDVHGALGSAQLYDPGSGTWTRTASMVTTRGGGTATLLRDGRVLVVGEGGEGMSIEIYDPRSGSWAPPPGRPWNPQRGYDMLTLLPDGMLLVFGGGGHSGTTAELYDPASGAWTVTASMGRPRDGATATLLPNGKVLVAGGRWGGSEYVKPYVKPTFVAPAELYDPGSGTP